MSTDEDVATKDVSLLVFGYGSLIWRPPPHVCDRIPGYITSHVRRFWQLSEDHRGTIEAPGRVVTLMSRDAFQAAAAAAAAGQELQQQAEEDKCWGVVYRIKPESVEEVRDYLNVREINGYSRTTIRVHTQTGPMDASVYIGTSENPQYSPLPDSAQGIMQTARHIKHAHGPSGSNEDYLLSLARALRQIQRDMVQDREEEGSDSGCGDWYVDAVVRSIATL